MINMLGNSKFATRLGQNMIIISKLIFNHKKEINQFVYQKYVHTLYITSIK